VATDDKPPLLGSWAQLYGVVLGALVALILAFTALGWVYR
jgi:hypothetical protein